MLQSNSEAWKISGNMKNILLGKLPPHPAIFFKKDVIKDIGNFDDNLTIIADLDWCIRVAKKGFKTYKLKKYIYDIVNEYDEKNISDNWKRVYR